MSDLSVTLSIVSVSIAAFALLFSIYTYRRTRALEQIQEELAQLQLEREKREALASDKAELGANFVRYGDGNWRLKIFNKGYATAHNVRVEFPEGNDLVLPRDIRDKFPHEALERGQGVELAAAPSHDTRRKLVVRLVWDDSAGSSHSKLAYPTL